MKEQPPAFNPNIPTVHSISGIRLRKEGWEQKGKVYEKDGKQIIYDGTYWKINGTQIQFMEDINQHGNDS